MAINLPGNVYLYKDGKRPWVLDDGDVVSFPAGKVTSFVKKILKKEAVAQK